MKTPHIPLGAALLATATSHAEAIPGQLFDHVPQRAWLENYDPTLVTSRYFAAGFAWYF